MARLTALGAKMHDMIYDTTAFPIHMFILPSLAYGIGFVFMSHARQIKESSLFDSMTGLGGGWSTMLWGILLLLVVVGSIHTMFYHNRIIGNTTAFLGFSAWLFASLIYLQDGLVILTMGVSAPNALFWLWLYFKSSSHKNMRP